MTYPIIIVQTTTDKMDTRMAMNADEHKSLVAAIIADPTTVKYEIFELVHTMTRTVKWEGS